MGSSLQGSEINKVIITEEKSFTHWNHAGKLSRTVITGHSAFPFGVFLPDADSKQKQSKHEGLSQSFPHFQVRLLQTIQKMNTNSHHMPCSARLCLSWEQHCLPLGSPILFVRSSYAFAILCSLFPDKPCFALGNPYYSITPKSGLGVFYSSNDWLTENSIIKIH